MAEYENPKPKPSGTMDTFVGFVRPWYVMNMGHFIPCALDILVFMEPFQQRLNWVENT